MRIAKLSILVSILLGFVLSGQAQMEEDHDHPRSELGISIAPVYYLNRESVHLGLHAHYTYNIGESPFGVGLGAEYILDEARHQTYSVVFQYNPLDHFHLIAAPGVALEMEHDDEDEDEEHEFEGEEHEEHEAHGAAFALHLEAVYEFHVGPLILGPSAEFAYDKHDIHMSLGLHVGIPFK